MRRDMDLVRELVLRIEAFPAPDGPLDSYWQLDASQPAMKFEGYTDAEVNYHVRLLAQAGFLVGVKELGGSSDVMAKGLSWSGHDFAASVRDPEIWHATKEGAKKVGGFSVDLLVALAKGFIKKKIEDHTGVKL
jgi:hypothetical protein